VLHPEARQAVPHDYPSAPRPNDAWRQFLGNRGILPRQKVTARRNEGAEIGEHAGSCDFPAHVPVRAQRNAPIAPVATL
jgi:hypothetical protein